MSESEEREISEYVYLPDVHSLAEQLRACLQVHSPSPHVPTCTVVVMWRAGVGGWGEVGLGGSGSWVWKGGFVCMCGPVWAWLGMCVCWVGWRACPHTSPLAPWPSLCTRSVQQVLLRACFEALCAWLVRAIMRQESEPIPSDFTQLFDDTLFKFDTNLIPEAVALYDVRGARCACCFCWVAPLLHRGCRGAKRCRHPELTRSFTVVAEGLSAAAIPS
jgi:hypothetical protein